MHRFLLREGDSVNERVFAIVSEELRNQWVKVLRFRVGEVVVLFCRDGKEYVCEIRSITPKIIEGRVTDVRVCESELPVKIIFAQSILKHPEKFEWILQKGTELGVSEFYPLITKRTERESLHKVERLQRILIEATEQCGRCVVPILHQPIKFEKFLGLDFLREKNSRFLIPHVGTSGRIGDFIGSTMETLCLCIGPEGGFLEQEIVAAEDAGGHTVTLGKRILRSETAALSALSIAGGAIEVS